MSLLLVVSAVPVASFLAVVAMLELARRRPLTATDIACAALDERLAQPAAKDRPAREPAAGPERSPRPGGAVAGCGARSPGVAA